MDPATPEDERLASGSAQVPSTIRDFYAERQSRLSRINTAGASPQARSITARSLSVHALRPSSSSDRGAERTNNRSPSAQQVAADVLLEPASPIARESGPPRRNALPLRVSNLRGGTAAAPGNSPRADRLAAVGGLASPLKAGQRNSPRGSVPRTTSGDPYINIDLEETSFPVLSGYEDDHTPPSSRRKAKLQLLAQQQQNAALSGGSSGSSPIPARFTHDRSGLSTPKSAMSSPRTWLRALSPPTVGPSDELAPALRRLDAATLPLLCGALLSAGLARLAVVYAGQSMSADLMLGADVPGLVATCFAAGCLLMQVPSMVGYLRTGPAAWLGFMVLMCGCITILTSLVRSSGTLYVTQAMLGSVQAGLLPCTYLYLAYLYPEDRLLPRLLMVGGISNAAEAVAPLLSAPLLMMHDLRDLAGWRWLFVMMGIPAVSMGYALMSHLPCNIPQVPGLKPVESKLMEVSIVYGTVRALHEDYFGRLPGLTRFMMGAAKLRRTWLLAAVVAPVTLVTSSLTYWLPAAVNHLLTHQGMTTGGSSPGSARPTMFGERQGLPKNETGAYVALLLTLPYLAGWVGQLGVAASTWRYRRWCLHMLLPMLLAMTCLFAFPAASKHSSALGATMLCVAVAALHAASLVPLAAAAHLAQSDNRAVAVLLILSQTSALGGLIGPAMVGAVSISSGTFEASAYLLGCFLILATIALGALWHALHPRLRLAATREQRRTNRDSELCAVWPAWLTGVRSTQTRPPSQYHTHITITPYMIWQNRPPGTSMNEPLVVRGASGQLPVMPCVTPAPKQQALADSPRAVTPRGAALEAVYEEQEFVTAAERLAEVPLNKHWPTSTDMPSVEYATTPR